MITHENTDNVTISKLYEKSGISRAQHSLEDLFLINVFVILAGHWTDVWHVSRQTKGKICPKLL